MKSFSNKGGSGCLLWFLAFVLVSLCLCPGAAFVGGFSSTLQADKVAKILQPYLCPDKSVAEIVTHQTTIRDDSGFESPATGYEMQCIDASGDIVRAASPDYAFYWIGVLAAGSLLLSGVLGILLAVPVGSYLARRKPRVNKSIP